MKNEIQGTSLVKGYKRPWMFVKRHRSGGVEVECCERIINHVMELSGWSTINLRIASRRDSDTRSLVWRRDRISGSSVVP